MAERQTRRRRRRRRENWKNVLYVLVLVLLLIFGAVRLRYALMHRDLPGSNVSVPDFVTVDYIPTNEYSRPGTPLETISGVVVHYVGNPGTTAAANRSFFANLALTHETYASAHFLVGLDGEILQCVPLTEIAYCSNTANDYTVSIEVCHPDDTGKFDDATMESLEKLVAWLCETFDLDPTEDVIRHYDVTGKICPKYYVENEDAWLAFKQDVSARIEEDKTANGETN